MFVYVVGRFRADGRTVVAAVRFVIEDLLTAKHPQFVSSASQSERFYYYPYPYAMNESVAHITHVIFTMFFGNQEIGQQIDHIISYHLLRRPSFVAQARHSIQLVQNSVIK